MCARGIELAFFLRFFYWIHELFWQCDLVFLFILSVILKYLILKNQRSDIVFPFMSFDKKRSNRTFNIIICSPVLPFFFYSNRFNSIPENKYLLNIEFSSVYNYEVAYQLRVLSLEIQLSREGRFGSL